MKDTFNERGAVLLYVLITLFIILLIVPIAYQQITQERNETLRLLQQVQANQLAETSMNRILNDDDLFSELYGHTSYDGGRNTEIDLYVSAYDDSENQIYDLLEMEKPYTLEVIAYVGDKNKNRNKDQGESLFYRKNLEKTFPKDEDGEDPDGGDSGGGDSGGDETDGLVVIIDSNGTRYEGFDGIITADHTYDGAPIDGDVIIKSGVGKFEMKDSIMVKATGTITVEPGVDLTVLGNAHGNSTLEFYSSKGDIILDGVKMTNDKPSSQNILSLVAETGSISATNSYLSANRKIKIWAQKSIDLSKSHIAFLDQSKSEAIEITSFSEDVVCVDQLFHDLSFKTELDETYTGDFRGSLREDGNGMEGVWNFSASCP